MSKRPKPLPCPWIHFRSIYAGLGAAAAGSAPTAALFFLTYEGAKGAAGDLHDHPLVHMGAASCGEVAACLVRVPVEIVKQRRQANSKGAGSIQGSGKNGSRILTRGHCAFGAFPRN